MLINRKVYLFTVMILTVIKNSVADNRRMLIAQPDKQLKTLVELLIDEVAESSRCIVSLVDTYYRRKVNINQLKAYNFLPMYRVLLRENEEFSPPRRRLVHILEESRYLGCDIYLILMANGLQVVDFLRYTEEERLINAQGKFIIMYDFRIFHNEMRYLWNRIVNVVFLRHYVDFKRRSNRQLQKIEWYDINTIPFPAYSKGLVVTKYIDTWYQNRFRYGIDHFLVKTNNLRKQKLRVAVFEHIPAVTEDARVYYKNQNNVTLNSKPLGIEFEMLLIIANVLNFKPEFYQPDNIQIEKWGSLNNDTLTGLFGEAKVRHAVFYLGDIYYSQTHLQILELSWPYNTECLTFLTLESLTENSWKLLILPFKLDIWITVIFTLFLASVSFFFFARFYKHHVHTAQTAVIDEAPAKMIVKSKNFELVHKEKSVCEEWEGLYLFTDPQNTFLYTFSMLMQVSLPMLPRAWSVRIFIGWWWVFSILITVIYKASITATLTNAIDRVTIDSIPELVQSSVAVGSWSDEPKDIFQNSSDPLLQKLSQRYITITDEQDAIAAVANGSFCYYENIYVLGRERVKRQIVEVELLKNGSDDKKYKSMDHNLHIMEECVINVPIALGLDKHSPLKYHVDKLIKRIIEAGFVQKWLSDITAQSKILELRQEGTAQKALMDFDKLQGAVVAVAIGYFLSIVALVAEHYHFKHYIAKHPNYSKYRMDLFYKKI